MDTFLWVAAVVAIGWTLLGLVLGAVIGTLMRRARTEASLREMLTQPVPAYAYARSARDYPAGSRARQAPHRTF